MLHCKKSLCKSTYFIRIMCNHKIYGDYIKMNDTKTIKPNTNLIRFTRLIHSKKIIDKGFY